MRRNDIPRVQLISWSVANTFIAIHPGRPTAKHVIDDGPVLGIRVDRPGGLYSSYAKSHRTAARDGAPAQSPNTCQSYLTDTPRNDCGLEPCA